MKKTCLVVTVLLVLLLTISGIMTLVGKDSISFNGKSIGLVRIEGPIIQSEEIMKEIRKYASDNSIKAILIRVNSPGGVVAPSQEIYEEVTKAVKKKPVVVSMGALAASGAYYISAPATKIVANPGTLTASIGVIMEFPNLSGLMQKIGIKTEVIKSGKHKDIASAFRGVGKEERQILQNILDNVHEQFIRAVAEGRKMDISKVRKIADGRVVTGQQALGLGLVDELGNFEDAKMIAAHLAGIKGEPRIVEKKVKKSILSLLNSSIAGNIGKVLPAIGLKYIFSL
ncbi:putative signal peptide peptidase SppA [bacterium BMS3Abin07]|nr:putative signal peptide peptidase SppA [bacterium BMS3Abin07]GBE33234.1 putative signal peptide peptidase SppA [bacterium BMS3Bbin05]HDO21687.1 signal peptide peptidase SppA [Nitrospirota bacterium]HDZ88777.1 signal peptide peptidase SppA [Nitrospirota bacterium]